MYVPTPEDPESGTVAKHAADITEPNWATPVELRSAADLAESLNELKRGIEAKGSALSFDNIDVFDSNGDVLTVLQWRMEADSFTVKTGG